MPSTHASSTTAIKRQRTAKLASLGTKAYYLHRRGKDDEMYTLICDEFVLLGGIYIKFLQGVLLQSQAMRKWQSPDRLNIFENLDHEPLDIVSILQSELPTDKLKQITLVQPQPFAAGSFGQVYYAQHANGKPIIIKVLRPMVRELLRYDLRLLGMFTRSMVNRMNTNMDMDPEKAIKDFRRATLRETDYISEAHFAHELFETYKDHPTFIIPETYLDLCSPNIIVQEYIDGLSVAQLIRMKEQGVDPKQYVMEVMGSNLDIQLETLGVEQLAGVFNLPRIQGDPHPGNIRLLPENKVGMIDFGIAAPTPENKAAFFGVVMAWDQIYSNDFDVSRLFEQFIRFFVSDLYRALQKLSSITRKSNDESTNYAREIGRIAQDTFKKTVGITDIRPMIEDGRVLQIINQVINKNNRFGLVMKLEASEILRASQTYITLVEALGRRNTVLPEVFDSVVKRVNIEHPELMHETEEPVGVAEAIDIVSNWLERVANRDPALFHQLIKRVKLGPAKLKSKVTNSGSTMPHTEVTLEVEEKEKIHA